MEIFVYDRDLRHERVKPQMENLCKNPGQKLHALAKIANHMWGFARFGSIYTILKNLKNTHGQVVLFSQQ